MYECEKKTILNYKIFKMALDVMFAVILVVFFCLIYNDYELVYNYIGKYRIHINWTWPFIFVVSNIIHEFGHVLEAKALGIKVYSVSMLSFGKTIGSKTNMENLERFSKSDRFKIYFSGVLANLKIAVLAGVMVCLTKGRISLFVDIVLLNIILIFINCIPFNESDGQKLKNLLNDEKYELFKRIFYLFIIVGGGLITYFMRCHI